MSEHHEMRRVGRPTAESLRTSGRLDKAHESGEYTYTSVDVWHVGRPTNEWRIYTDQHGIEHVIPEMLAKAPSAALARTLRNRLGVIYANVDDEGVSG